jgi:hypothetical protein
MYKGVGKRTAKARAPTFSKADIFMLGHPSPKICGLVLNMYTHVKKKKKEEEEEE